MNPIDIEGWNVRFAKPANWNTERDGECVTLAVRKTTEFDLNLIESAWMPTPEELEMLKQGKPVVLTIFGTGMPPVALRVE